MSYQHESFLMEQETASDAEMKYDDGLSSTKSIEGNVQSVPETNSDETQTEDEKECSVDSPSLTVDSISSSSETSASEGEDDEFLEEEQSEFGGLLALLGRYQYSPFI